MQDNRNSSDKYSGDTGAGDLLAKLKKNIAETGGQPAEKPQADPAADNNPLRDAIRAQLQADVKTDTDPEEISREVDDIKARLKAQLSRDLKDNAELIEKIKSSASSDENDTTVKTEQNIPQTQPDTAKPVQTEPEKPDTEKAASPEQKKPISTESKKAAPTETTTVENTKNVGTMAAATASDDKESVTRKSSQQGAGAGKHGSAIDPRSAVYHFKTMSKAEYKAQREAAPKLRELPLDRYKDADTKVIPKVTNVAASGAGADEKATGAVSALEEKLNRKKRDDISTRIKDAEEYAKKLGNTEKAEKAPHAHAKGDDELDDTDVNLMIAFGMDKELKEKIGEDKANEIEADIDKKSEGIEDKVLEGGVAREEKKRFEFTSNAQAKKIFAGYKRVYHGLLWRIAACVALIILTFLYENIPALGGSLPTPIDAQIYPIVHILIGLQLLVLSGALIYKPLYNGMLSLFRLKPAPESITFVLMLFTFIYHIALCFMHIPGGPVLYNFPMTVVVLMTLICEFMNLRREIYSFNIASSKRQKQVIAKVSEKDSDGGADAFYDYLPENPVLFKVQKASFIDGFYRRMRAYPRGRSVILAFVPLVLCIAIIFAAAACIIDGTAYDGLRIGYVTLLMAMPFSILVTYSYPFFKASREAFSAESAIIGETSLEEYASGSAVTFDDREVFPAVGVKVKTVQVVGKFMIDEVMYYASCVFGKTGGPLADVLDIATLDLHKTPDVEVLEIAENGIDAVVDGRRVFIGKADYMKDRNIMPINPGEDDDIEGGGEVCVLYLAVSSNIAAKFYIQYLIDSDFEYILKQLYKAGLCIGIKSSDPNVNDRMLSARIKLSKYPVKVIKCGAVPSEQPEEDHSDSGIVTRGSAKNLLTTLTLCDRVLHVTKTNTVVKIFSIVISVIIMAFVLMMGKAGDMSSWLVAVYQLFWVLPMVIIAKLLI